MSPKFPLFHSLCHIANTQLRSYKCAYSMSDLKQLWKFTLYNIFINAVIYVDGGACILFVHAYHLQ